MLANAVSSISGPTRMNRRRAGYQPGPSDIPAATASEAVHRAHSARTGGESVQRRPAVPIAAKAIARSASSRSAERQTMAALLPPSSSIARSKTLGQSRRDVRAPSPLIPLPTPAAGADHRSAWPVAHPRSRPPIIPQARRRISVRHGVTALAPRARSAASFPKVSRAPDRRKPTLMLHPGPHGDGKIERGNDASGRSGATAHMR